MRTRSPPLPRVLATEGRHVEKVASGACALDLALLAGCTIYADDPDPPPQEPPPEQEPPPPPLPMGNNVSGNEHDPVNHRLLISDCPNKALLALDLTTGERSVRIDSWPWTEPGNEPCVHGLVAPPSTWRPLRSRR